MEGHKCEIVLNLCILVLQMWTDNDKIHSTKENRGKLSNKNRNCPVISQLRAKTQQRKGEIPNMNEIDANKKAEELLHGAYDLHVHSSPSVFPRAMDGFQIIQEADAAGMAGILLKSHYESTALRAELINRYSGCRAKAYGGLCLNWPVGGLNVYAVKNALKAGAKVIWMPTRDAENSLVFGNMSGDFFNREGISILNADGSLKDCVYDIMDAVKEQNAFLATGHISPEESIILCRKGRKRSVNMILTHPEFPRTMIPADQQAELAKMGVLIEKNWFNIVQKSVTAEKMAETIQEVGSNCVYMATDRGQKNAPSPVSELKRFIVLLLLCGISEEQIRDMVQRVPQEVVCR